MLDIIKGILEAVKSLLKGYSVKLRSETVTTNKRFNDDIYGGWLAVNIGETDVRVYGITLKPGEGLSSQSITNMSAADRWEEPIDIEIPTQPGAVRLLRSVNKKRV